MEVQIVLGILSVAGMLSVFMYALKGLLDQIADLIRSWRRVLVEARRPQRSASSETREAGSSSGGPDGG